MSIIHTQQIVGQDNLGDQVSKNAWNAEHTVNLLGLIGQEITIPYNGKIADITHADVNKHTLDLETALTESRQIIGVILHAQRVSGTGSFRGYANEGGVSTQIRNTADTSATIIIAAGTQRFEYNLTVANDDFDLYCIGYWVVSA